MSEADRINTRKTVTLAQIPLHTILIALVVLLFVSVVSASLLVADSVESAAGIAPQARMSMRELCKALGPGNPTYPCYSEPKLTTNNFLYGFHTGAGHGKQHAKEYSVTVGPHSYFLTRDDGRQYSVDRCALAHDSFYWSREARDNKINDYNFVRCIQKVAPPANDPDEQVAKTLVLRGGISSITRIFQKPLGGWRELPEDAIDIPEEQRSTPRDISSSEIKMPSPASIRGSASCGTRYPGSFHDRRNGGECWQCPAGYNRTGVSFGKGLPAVDSKDACVKGEVAGIGGKFTSAKLKGKPCSPGSWEHGVTALCYACPNGYKRNPNLNLSLKVDLRKIPDACIAN